MKTLNLGREGEGRHQPSQPPREPTSDTAHSSRRALSEPFPCPEQLHLVCARCHCPVPSLVTTLCPLVSLGADVYLPRLALEHLFSSTLLSIAGIMPRAGDTRPNKQLSYFPSPQDLYPSQGHRLLEGKGYA